MTGIIPGVAETHFWQQLSRPIIGLSPMDGVTDYAFRQIQKKYGNPDIVYTEFTSVEGVCHGAMRLLTDFLYHPSQRPIIGQIYGTTPDYFRQTTILLCHLGFDGVDINMGCPAKNVAHSGAGAALIKTPHLAQQIITQVQAGIEDWKNGRNPSNCPDITWEIAQAVELRHQQLPALYQNRQRSIPVSVKTRIGYGTEVVADWIPVLLETELAAIAVHGRTLKQQYSGQANWEAIGKAAEIARASTTLLIGNGDIHSQQQAIETTGKYGLDGVLIGRAAMGNPYVFLPPKAPKLSSLFQIALEHAILFEQTCSSSERYSFLPMRKHLGWYVKQIPNASQIRIELFKTNTSQEVEDVLQRHGLLSN